MFLDINRQTSYHHPHPLDPEMWGEWPHGIEFRWDTKSPNFLLTFQAFQAFHPTRFRFSGLKVRWPADIFSLLKMMWKTIAHTMQWETYKNIRTWHLGSNLNRWVLHKHTLNGQGCCFSPSWPIIPNNLCDILWGKVLWLISYLPKISKKNKNVIQNPNHWYLGSQPLILDINQATCKRPSLLWLTSSSNFFPAILEAKTAIATAYLENFHFKKIHPPKKRKIPLPNPSSPSPGP